MNSFDIGGARDGAESNCHIRLRLTFTTATGMPCCNDAQMIAVSLHAEHSGSDYRATNATARSIPAVDSTSL